MVMIEIPIMEQARVPVPQLPFPDAAAALAALTRREMEVVTQLSAGHSNAAIAQVLRCSPSTLRSHLATIACKLGTSDRSAMAAMLGATCSQNAQCARELFRQAGLTAREREVLLAMVQGMSDAEIGRRLGVTINTVKTHTKKLFRKLELPNRTVAAYWYGCLQAPAGGFTSPVPGQDLLALARELPWEQLWDLFALAMQNFRGKISIPAPRSPGRLPEWVRGLNCFMQVRVVLGVDNGAYRSLVLSSFLPPDFRFVKYGLLEQDDHRIARALSFGMGPDRAAAWLRLSPELVRLRIDAMCRSLGLNRTQVALAAMLHDTMADSEVQV